MKYIANPVEVDAWEITEIGERDFAGLMVTLEDGSKRLVTDAEMDTIEPRVGYYFVVHGDGRIEVIGSDILHRDYSPCHPSPNV